MKKIKAVVLKDATKLTNSQMKEIRGGWYEYSSSVICTAECESGALQEFVKNDCSKIYGATCVISRDEYDTQAICVNENGIRFDHEEYIDSCGNPPLPPTR